VQKHNPDSATLA